MSFARPESSVPPSHRLRRWRATPQLRALVRETSLAPSDLVWPLFVAEGLEGTQEIAAMPGQFRHGLDALVAACEEALEAGIGSVCLFGVPGSKDANATSASSEDGIVQRALRLLRERKLPLVLMADTCLCQYTDHGHCGLLRDGVIDNDASIEIIARVAASQIEAGADVVVPSDMLDGRVAAIRAELDRAGRSDALILSHAVKYASAYYGPFRQAADSAPSSGDRRSHQMDPANVREAERSALRDVAEGADAVMVKPALAYLDVIARVRAAVGVPVAAYAVSGEYAMIEAAGRAGMISRDAVMLESLLAMKRAGADIILTYHAPEAARLLRSG